MSGREDTISREAAIDAVNTWLRLNSLNRTMSNAMSIQGMLRALPSAQPEIVRCKDCRWKYQNNCCLAVELFIHDEDFCSWAERREE